MEAKLGHMEKFRERACTMGCLCFLGVSDKMMTEYLIVNMMIF